MAKLDEEERKTRELDRVVNAARAQLRLRISNRKDPALAQKINKHYGEGDILVDVIQKALTPNDHPWISQEQEFVHPAKHERVEGWRFL